jgi:hypothetical protein
MKKTQPTVPWVKKINTAAISLLDISFAHCGKISFDLWGDYADDVSKNDHCDGK